MTDKKSTLGHRILTGVGIALCVILIPMLIINCTLLIKGWTNNAESVKMNSADAKEE